MRATATVQQCQREDMPFRTLQTSLLLCKNIRWFSQARGRTPNHSLGWRETVFTYVTHGDSGEEGWMAGGCQYKWNGKMEASLETNHAATEAEMKDLSDKIEHMENRQDTLWFVGVPEGKDSKDMMVSNVRPQLGWIYAATRDRSVAQDTNTTAKARREKARGVCVWLLNLTMCASRLGMWSSWDIQLREKRYFLFWIQTIWCWRIRGTV